MSGGSMSANHQCDCQAAAISSAFLIQQLTSLLYHCLPLLLNHSDQTLQAQVLVSTGLDASLIGLQPFSPL